MSWCREYKLVRENEELVAMLYLNIDQAEFSNELLESIKENFIEVEGEIKKLIDEKFPDSKVSCAKLIVGALVVGTVCFIPQSEVKAEINDTNVTAITQQAQSANLAIIKVNTIGTVKASKLNVRNGESTNNIVIHQLYQGNRVKVIGILSGWCQIQLSDGRTGWVSKTYLALDIESTSREARVDKVVATSRSLLGTPYVWGGDSITDGGFDCSGLTQYTFKSVGYTLNRISVDQSKQGEYVAKENLQAGDLVFYSLAADGRVSHVGIYIGDGKMIHSPKAGDVTKVTDITTDFWKIRFIVARRVF
jgi:cell wall-associated NlpC family hydrolase